MRQNKSPPLVSAKSLNREDLPVQSTSHSLHTSPFTIPALRTSPLPQHGSESKQATSFAGFRQLLKVLIRRRACGRHMPCGSYANDRYTRFSPQTQLSPATVPTTQIQEASHESPAFKSRRPLLIISPHILHPSNAKISPQTVHTARWTNRP